MALLHCAISSLRRPRSPWTRPARGCGCRLGTERSPAQRGAAEGAGATIGGATIVAANVMGVGAAAAMIGGAKRGDAGAMTSAAVTTVAETTTAAATAVMTEGGSRYAKVSGRAVKKAEKTRVFAPKGPSHSPSVHLHGCIWPIVHPTGAWECTKSCLAQWEPATRKF